MKQIFWMYFSAYLKMLFKWLAVGMIVATAIVRVFPPLFPIAMFVLGFLCIFPVILSQDFRASYQWLMLTPRKRIHLLGVNAVMTHAQVVTAVAVAMAAFGIFISVNPRVNQPSPIAKQEKPGEPKQKDEIAMFGDKGAPYVIVFGVIAVFLSILPRYKGFQRRYRASMAEPSLLARSGGVFVFGFLIWSFLFGNNRFFYSFNFVVIMTGLAVLIGLVIPRVARIPLHTMKTWRNTVFVTGFIFAVIGVTRILA